MTLLILGVLLFAAAHLYAILLPGPRAALTNAIGLIPSKALLAVVTLGSVWLMVEGYASAEYVEVWLPPAFLIHLHNLLMLIAIFLFLAGNMPSGVRRKIRHPQLAATKVWALAHLLVNGDLASVVLFGGLLAWAVVAMIGSNRRDGPRGELPATQKNGLIAHLAITAVLFAVVTYVHGFLLNVWPFPV